MISLTKPLSPGRPTEAITKKTMKVAQIGIFAASPPSSRIERVWYRSYMKPIRKKRAPVERPWLIMYITEPVMPTELTANRPSMQKPRWLTDEYATSFLMSVCTQQIRPA